MSDCPSQVYVAGGGVDGIGRDLALLFLLQEPPRSSDSGIGSLDSWPLCFITVTKQ